MIKKLSPSRKDQIREILEKEGKALTLDALVKSSGIPENKIRQVLTTFESRIVRIGPKTYDLVERIYPEKIFRYTPEKVEIENGILKAEEDIHLFLTAASSYFAEITLVDKDSKIYHLSRAKNSKIYPFSYYSGLSKWYKKTGFEFGDDMIFTCISLKDYKYNISRQNKKDRDELVITSRNRQLADIVFDILIHTISKYEMDLFLVRKYLYIYPFNHPIPPDHLKRALANDKRFLLSHRERMLSWTGHPLLDEFTVGLRKYYFQNENKEYIPVLMDEDEFGKFGCCAQCYARLIWEEGHGWRHAKNDMEIIDSYIPKSFFTIDKKPHVN